MLNRGNAKQYAKQALRRTVGEPYVGKRLKLRRLPRVMKTSEHTAIHPRRGG